MALQSQKISISNVDELSSENINISAYNVLKNYLAEKISNDVQSL
jgi:hypothetical protein